MASTAPTTASSSSIGLIVNGEARMVRATTLAALIEELGLGAAKVATAVNGEFVAAGARSDMRLHPGDRIEVVAPRQGG